MQARWPSVPCRAGPPCRSGSPGPTLMPFGSCWTGPRHGGPQMGQGRAKHEIRETEEKSGSKMHILRNSSYESLESTHHRNIHTSNSSHIKFLVGLSVGSRRAPTAASGAGSLPRRPTSAAACYSSPAEQISPWGRPLAEQISPPLARRLAAPLAGAAPGV
jgi:hypothetical protein